MWARRVLELDFDDIEKWYDQREQVMPDRSLYPKMGFMVNGIAAGFIYFTDSSVSIIDGYISNPTSYPRDRDEALNLITEELIKYAKLHNCTVIKCDTKLETVKKRALEFKFKSTGFYESFVLET